MRKCALITLVVLICAFCPLNAFADVTRSVDPVRLQCTVNKHSVPTDPQATLSPYQQEDEAIVYSGNEYMLPSELKRFGMSPDTTTPTLIDIFNVLITGSYTEQFPEYQGLAPATTCTMSIDKNQPVTILLGDCDETIDKKIVIKKSDDAAALIQEDDETITITHNSTVNLKYVNPYTNYNFHEGELTFSKGIEIDGADVKIYPDGGAYGTYVAKLICTFGGDLIIKNGGKLDIKGADEYEFVNYGEQYAVDYSTQLKFNDGASIKIGEEEDIADTPKSELTVSSSQIIDEATDRNTPLVTNNGKMTLDVFQDKKNEKHNPTQITSSSKQPAIQCSEDSEITITGGGTVESQGETAVDLKPGATLNTSEDSDKAVKAGEDGLTMDNYGDLHGRVKVNDQDFSMSDLVVKDSDGVISGELNSTEMLNAVIGDKKANPDANYALRVDPLPSPPTGLDNKIESGKVVEYRNIYIAKNGEEFKIEGGNIDVKISIGDADPTKNNDIKVYHYTGAPGEETWTPVTTTKVRDGEVSFKADSFSPYSFVYTRTTAPIENPATKVRVYLSSHNNREYDIMLEGNERKINGFMSSEFDFEYKPDVSDPGNISYEIVSADNINIIRPSDEEDAAHYEFNVDGIERNSIPGTPIKLGTVIFSGYGNGTFKITNGVVHTEKTADNIVDTFEYSGGTGNLEIGDPQNINIPVETVPVQINVMFPNEVETDNSTDYTDMAVIVKGGAETEQEPFEREIKLGSDSSASEGIEVEETSFKYTDDGVEDLSEDGSDANANGYVIKLNVPVPEGVGNRYTFTFKGAGYRTYSVDAVVKKNGETPFTVTVWNNVMDEDTHVVVTSDGSDKSTARAVTFLAGDIVEDNTINLYDLSAAVAYFGKTGMTETTDKDYIRYDLNRDGAIDSKDIAMVLVSWNN